MFTTTPYVLAGCRIVTRVRVTDEDARRGEGFARQMAVLVARQELAAQRAERARDVTYHMLRATPGDMLVEVTLSGLESNEPEPHSPWDCLDVACAACHGLDPD